MLQSVVPQVPVAHVVAAAQQCVPAPVVPQRVLVHWSLVEHAPPFATRGRHVPVLVQ